APMPDSTARRTLLTFIIVGGGPTGVETAGALAEFRRHVVPRDYPSIPPEHLRIVLIETREAVLGTFAVSSQKRARRDLGEFGAELGLGTSVERVPPEGVALVGGERRPAGTVVWAAGIRAADVATRLGLPTGTGGRIRVTPNLEVVGYPGIFAAGD